MFLSDYMDQSLKHRLIERLKDDIDSLPPRLEAVAKYVIDHPADFGLNPIRETASTIGVSPNSLVRLAQKMGFDSFDAFREPFREALVTDGERDLGEDWINRMQDAGETGGLQARAARNEINIVSRSLRLMTPEKVQGVVDCLLKAERRFVTATRASYAVAYYFHYVGRMALPDLNLIPRHMGSAVDELVEGTANDVLIAMTLAPYSAETIKALRFARARGMKIVLISDSELVAPNIEADHVLTVAANSTHYFGCYVGAMAVVECLLSHLVAAGGDQIRKKIGNYNDVREESGAYWSPSKLPRIR
ncbi:MurR/RpiR family transcriptional regulator [Falsiruegeria litorea]